MEFSQRVRQILQIMLNREGVMPVQALADEIGVSKRTIQRELGYLENDLKPFHIRFMSKTGAGVWLEGEPEDRERLAEAIQCGDGYDAANREERRKRLILEILKDKSLKKLFYYSSQFGVSEATVSADLDAVEEWLGEQELKVVRKPGSGISIEGSEESYRRAIRRFVDENMDTKLVRESYERGARLSQSVQVLRSSGLGQVLNDDILSRVVDCVTGMEDARIRGLTESSFLGLVLHITIAVNRILKDEIIEQEEAWMRNLEHDESWQLAQTIAGELEEEFEIEIPRTEIHYICLHIRGAKHQKIETGQDSLPGIENSQLQRLVNEMIQAFDPERAFELRQDEEFLQGLLAHLQPTFVRLLHNMKIENPVLAEIQRDYPEVYRRCCQVAAVLERWLGRPLPDAEVGFLTVHFGAALVRIDGKKEDIRLVDVGVVCSSGIGISRLMASKLEKTFRGRIRLTTYGQNDVTPYAASHTDFFVSSLPVELPDVPVIRVNPLLNDEDMEQIRRMIIRYERIPKKKDEETEFTMELAQVNLVATQIKTILKYMDFYKVSNGISFQELLLDIGEKLSPYSDRSLQIQEDILARERIASQVFAEFGFALLHARTAGVIRPCFHIWMTKDLQSFTDPFFKEITVVLVLLIPEDENLAVNREIIGYLSGMIVEDEQFLVTIRRGNREEIRALLTKYLRQYFNRYLSQM